jgi:putative membrane protein
MTMTTMHHTMIALATAVALALPAVASAQQAPAKPSKTESAPADAKGSMAAADRKFVTEAARGGMAEVELGKLATERASSDGVKQFGQRMVTDHGKVNEELKGLAQQKGVALPADVGDKHRKLHARLAKLSGAEFDRAYVDEMVKDHRKDVSEFRREAGQAKDPDLKAWAGKTLPTLEDHLKQIQGLQAQVKGGGRAAK